MNCFCLSMDGFGAGPDQSLDHPLGIGGRALQGWMFETRAFRSHFEESGGDAGLDDDLTWQSMENVGAWIMGRNMFGPVRGPWDGNEWKGWWGDNPPYHCDVFVLSHYEKEPVSMAGGTRFHFVTDGIHSALARARAAAGDKDVRIGGGVSTVRQYLAAGLVDELHLAVSPVVLGKGEHLLTGLDLKAAGLSRMDYFPSPQVAHYVLRRPGPDLQETP